MSADEDPTERVDRLLEEADEVLEDDGDAEEPPGDDELDSVVEEARELFEATDTTGLLDAVGVDVSEASDPSELLPALAGADEESLVRFRRLRLLSQIEGDAGDDGSALEEFEALGAVLDEDAETDLDDLEGDVLDVDSMDLFEDGSAEGGDAGGGEPDGGDDEADAEEADAEAEPAADADDAEAAEAEADEEAESQADAEGDGGDGGLADQAGALQEALDEIKERVGDDEGEAPAEATGATDQSAAEADDEGDGPRGSSDSERSTRPSSDRADMRIPPRHSTMPK